eukprot:CAMPEP_0194061762 /NCGR_PEP_ID=MMETSP0009_2-20130614/75562_1 /TAXON_ID=210454 /ORGANISM="Grammatophora oceanica, Strain CCMP 410" /LENGTH=35 /DNA_ID= /DNA_START= /DNA_END= /DNA_ORIENTATION=
MPIQSLHPGDGTTIVVQMMKAGAVLKGWAPGGDRR